MKIYDEEETLVNRRQSPSSAEKPVLRSPSSGERPELSVFLPVYNEEPNLLPLHAKLDEALKALGQSAEIIYVDDGSSDASLQILRELARLDGRARVVA